MTQEGAQTSSRSPLTERPLCDRKVVAPCAVDGWPARRALNGCRKSASDVGTAWILENLRQSLETLVTGLLEAVQLKSSKIMAVREMVCAKTLVNAVGRLARNCSWLHRHE